MEKNKIMLHGCRQLYSLHKIEDIYLDIAKDVENRFDTSNDELDRPLPIGKNKKVIGLMKNELCGKIIEFAALRPNTYSYLADNNDEDEKAKDTRKCVTKRKIKFEDYKPCLDANQLENEIHRLEKNNLNEDNI